MDRQAKDGIGMQREDIETSEGGGEEPASVLLLYAYRSIPMNLHQCFFYTRKGLFLWWPQVHIRLYARTQQHQEGNGAPVLYQVLEYHRSNDLPRVSL